MTPAQEEEINNLIVNLRVTANLLGRSHILDHAYREGFRFPNQKMDMELWFEKINAYHGTNSDFQSFSDDKRDIGWHFGSIATANDRLKMITPKGSNEDDDTVMLPPYGLADAKGANIRPVTLDISKALRLPEQIAWVPYNILRALRKKNIIDSVEFDKIKSEFGLAKYTDDKYSLQSDHNKKCYDKLRQVIEGAGYDAIVYKNKFEYGDKPEDSYIVWRGKQIKPLYQKDEPIPKESSEAIPHPSGYDTAEDFIKSHSSLYHGGEIKGQLKLNSDSPDHITESPYLSFTDNNKVASDYGGGTFHILKAGKDLKILDASDFKVTHGADLVPDVDYKDTHLKGDDLKLAEDILAGNDRDGSKLLKAGYDGIKFPIALLAQENVKGNEIRIINPKALDKIKTREQLTQDWNKGNPSHAEGATKLGPRGGRYTETKTGTKEYLEDEDGFISFSPDDDVIDLEVPQTIGHDIDVERYHKEGAENTKDFRGGTWYSQKGSETNYGFKNQEGSVGGSMHTEKTISLQHPLLIRNANLEDGAFAVINNGYENALPAKYRSIVNKLWGDTHEWEDEPPDYKKLRQKALVSAGLSKTKIDEVLNTPNSGDVIFDLIISKGLAENGYDSLILENKTKKGVVDRHIFNISAKETPTVAPRAKKSIGVGDDASKGEGSGQKPKSDETRTERTHRIQTSGDVAKLKGRLTKIENRLKEKDLTDKGRGRLQYWHGEVSKKIKELETDINHGPRGGQYRTSSGGTKEYFDKENNLMWYFDKQNTIFYRGAPSPEFGKGDFPGLWVSTDRKDAEQYGNIHKYSSTQELNLLDTDSTQGKNLAQIYVERYPREEEMVNQTGDFTELWAFPTKNLKKMLTSFQFDGYRQSTSPSYFIIDPEKKLKVIHSLSSSAHKFVTDWTWKKGHIPLTAEVEKELEKYKPDQTVMLYRANEKGTDKPLQSWTYQKGMAESIVDNEPDKYELLSRRIDPKDVLVDMTRIGDDNLLNEVVVKGKGFKSPSKSKNKEDIIYHRSFDKLKGDRPDFGAYFGTKEFSDTFKEDFGSHVYALRMPKNIEDQTIQLTDATPAGNKIMSDIAKKIYPDDDKFPKELLAGDKKAIKDFYDIWTDKSIILKHMEENGIKSLQYDQEYLLPKETIDKLESVKSKGNTKTISEADASTDDGYDYKKDLQNTLQDSLQQYQEAVKNKNLDDQHRHAFIIKQVKSQLASMSKSSNPTKTTPNESGDVRLGPRGGKYKLSPSGIKEYFEKDDDTEIFEVDRWFDATTDHARLITHVNKHDWWRTSLPDDKELKDRGYFFASSFQDAEFYGRPLDDTFKVAIQNPLVGNNETIEKYLFGKSMSTDSISVEDRFALDKKMKSEALKKGYDSIVLMSHKDYLKYKTDGKMPRSIELNVLSKEGVVGGPGIESQFGPRHGEYKLSPSGAKEYIEHESNISPYDFAEDDDKDETKDEIERLISEQKMQDIINSLPLDEVFIQALNNPDTTAQLIKIVSEKGISPDIAIEFIKRKVPITRRQFDLLTYREKMNSFAVAQITQKRVLEKIQASIADALEEGSTIEQWRRKYRTLEDTFGLNAKADYQLDTIFRTNTQTAYGMGVWEQLHDPDVEDFFPYYQYHGIDDSRQRTNHASMAQYNGTGFIARSDAPIWKIWWIPNGFKCRCWITAISKFIADKKGWTKTYPIGPPPKDKPDIGFTGPKFVDSTVIV